ncbi:MAG: hypothetical protein K6E59_01370 [Bacilli bacterium]|nr:hypothetical protein [Bacilli bacterium]
MEKDLGYQEMLDLAQQLETRVNTFALDADDSQAKGMASYLASQENSIEQARFVLETYENDFLKLAKECIAHADKETAIALLEAYGKYGVKEF